MQISASDTVGKEAIVTLLDALDNSECANNPEALKALTVKVYHGVRAKGGEACAQAWNNQLRAHREDQSVPADQQLGVKPPAQTLKNAKKKGTQPISNSRRMFENYLEVRQADADMASACVAPFTGAEGEATFAERGRTLASVKDGRVIASRQQIRVGQYTDDRGVELLIPIPDSEDKEWNGSTTDEDGIERTEITVGSKGNEETITVEIVKKTQGKVFELLAEEQRREDLRGSIRTTWVRNIRDHFTPTNCVVPPVNPEHNETPKG
tara:strand:- start:1620 stop:2420 length:801 start_codon:yes stop_codon:yes gene_type:complete